MTTEYYDIFISYRREGGYDTAKHLNDLLVRDGYKVSFDIDTLRSGNFDTQLLERIDQCTDFILIVDQHAFDRTLDPNFDSKKDWFRCELAYALKQEKNVVPIFLNGNHSFPERLPEDIIEIEKKNGPQYNQYYFDEFYDKLKKKFLLSSPIRVTSTSHRWSRWDNVFVTLLIINVFLLLDEISAFICPRTYSSFFINKIIYQAYALIDFDVLYGSSSNSIEEATHELQDMAGIKIVLTLIALAFSWFGKIFRKKEIKLLFYLCSAIGFFLFFY